MAANILGLFFLILGTAGISNVFSLKEFFHRNKRSYFPIWPADPFDLNSFKRRTEALCRHKYEPFACRNIVYDLPYFRHGFEQGHTFENPFLDVVHDPNESSEENTHEHEDTIERHVNNEQRFFDYIRASTPSQSSGNPTESNAYSKSNTPATSSDKVNSVPELYATRKILSNVKFSSESNKGSQVTETTSNPDISQIIRRTSVERQQKSSSFTEKENIDLIEDKNTLPTLEKSSEGDTMESSKNNKDSETTSEYLTNSFRKNEETAISFTSKREDRINRLTFPITSYLTTSETKGFIPKKTSSLQEYFNKPLEKNLRTVSRLNQGYTEMHSTINREVTDLADKSSSFDGTAMVKNHVSKMFPNVGKKSTVFQDPFSFTTREVTYLNNKSNSPDHIQPISDKESKLEPIASQSSSSITNDEENSLKTDSSSSEIIYSVTNQNLDTESDTSLSSFTMTSHGTAPQSKLGSSFETQSTTTEILEIDSTTENSMSSNKVSSILFTDKVKENSRKETFSTESPSSKIHFTPEAITQDHIITISSIRTARIVVTAVFLAIALTALTILAVYMFRLRRREVEYDQLMLIT